MKTKILSKIILPCLLLLVTSCGGGGGDTGGSSASPAAATKIVSGVASNGAAMTGTVYLQDAKGTGKNAIIGNEGSFAISVDDLTAPFLLKAVSTDHATTRYSFAAAQGTVHINPFTYVAVAATAGTADLDTFYNSGYVNQHAALLSGFSENVALLTKQLGTLFTNFSVTDTDFLSGNVEIGKGLDTIFDNIKVDVNPTANTITLYGSDRNMPFITLTRQGSQMTLSTNAGNIPDGTTNITPVANAGKTQSVVTGALVTLDGSGSSDANGDLLTYNWAFTSKPNGSGATLSGPTAVKPTFTVDLVGTYVLNLVVNDGKVNSIPANVSISSTTNTGSITVKW
jgi:hypothetical protein